jgi:hypothetical protein
MVCFRYISVNTLHKGDDDDDDDEYLGMYYCKKTKLLSWGHSTTCSIDVNYRTAAA